MARLLPDLLMKSKVECKLFRTDPEPYTVDYEFIISILMVGS